MFWLETLIKISIYTVSSVGSLKSVSGSVKGFAVKIDRSEIVPLITDWPLFERLEAIIMHVA